LGVATVSFSENLKTNIRSKGFNTVSLAEKLDVTPSAIGFWQKGSRFPRKPEIIEEIISVLDITAIDLFGNKDESVRKIVEEELRNNLKSYEHFFLLKK
jgi:transcriptional regulator with XRE-family HTH domain